MVAQVAWVSRLKTGAAVHDRRRIRDDGQQPSPGLCL